MFLDVEAGAAAAAPAGFPVVDDAGADCGAVESSKGEDDQSYVDCAQLSNSFEIAPPEEDPPAPDDFEPPEASPVGVPEEEEEEAHTNRLVEFM